MSEISTYISSSPIRSGEARLARKAAAGPCRHAFSRMAQIGVHRTRSRPVPRATGARTPPEESGSPRATWREIDADGYVWYHGRADDLMNAGGFRVSPLEVETVLLQHPQVADAGVREWRVSDTASIIAAFLVPQDGCSALTKRRSWRLSGRGLPPISARNRSGSCLRFRGPPMASSSGKRWRDPEPWPTASSSTSCPTSSAPGASSASAASMPRWRSSTLDVFVRWRPYMLDPTIPPEGLDRQEYMLNKFGPERLKTIHDPLIEAGEELGVPYDFDAITRTPNTLDAHRLIRWSHTVERQHEMVERLFMAYWSEGKDVGDRDVLAGCAGEAGINAAQIRELLDSEQDVAETRPKSSTPPTSA